MSEVALLGSAGAVGGLALIAYYSLCKRQKGLENQRKDFLMKLEPSERLKCLKEEAGLLEANVSLDPYLPTLLRITSRKVLNDNEYFEVLKIFFPKLSSIEEWNKMCTSNVLSRYNFRGQY